MDIYILVILGFFFLFYDDDVDQFMLIEVDDEYIMSEVIFIFLLGMFFFFEVFNVYMRFMVILIKVVKYIYFVKVVEDCVNQGWVNLRYMISYVWIKEIEVEFQEWYEQFFIYWCFSLDGLIEVIRYVNFFLLIIWMSINVRFVEFEFC